MSDEMRDLGEMIAAAQADGVLDHDVAHGELALTATKGGLRNLVVHLRDNAACAFTTLIDVTAVDYPTRDNRFDVVYHFLSMTQNQRVRVRVAVAEDEIMPSITDLHPSADWYEREVFDMYGVTFEGHPDLRRLLLPEDWEGFPMRKDYVQAPFYNGIPTTRDNPLDLLEEESS